MNAQHRRCCNCGRSCGRNCSHCVQCTHNTDAISGEFREHIEELQIGTTMRFTPTFSTQEAHTITLFAKNTWGGPITVQMQNSPNGVDFVDDPQQLTLAAGETGHLVPYIFSKYMRVAASGDAAGHARIWFQMQNGRNYKYPV